MVAFPACQRCFLNFFSIRLGRSESTVHSTSCLVQDATERCWVTQLRLSALGGAYPAALPLTTFGGRAGLRTGRRTHALYGGDGPTPLSVSAARPKGNPKCYDCITPSVHLAMGNSGSEQKGDTSSLPSNKGDLGPPPVPVRSGPHTTPCVGLVLANKSCTR